MSTPALWYTRCPVPTAFGIALRLGRLQDDLAADGTEIKSLIHVPDRKVQSHTSRTRWKILSGTVATRRQSSAKPPAPTHV